MSQSRLTPRVNDPGPDGPGLDTLGPGGPGLDGRASKEAPTGWVWLAAWPITAVFVLSNVATPLYVLWQRDIGFSKGTLTVVFAFYIVGLLGSLLVSGVLSDRVGRKPVLLPALGLALAACAVFGTAGSVAALIVARLFTGVAVGAAVSAGMAAVTDVAGPHRRPLAALLASCAMVLGAGLGPFLAGVLSEVFPAPTVLVFVVEAVLLATAVLVVLRMPLPRRDRASEAGAVGGSADGSGDGSAGGSAGGAARPAGGAWLRVPRVPREGRTPLVLGISVFAPGITATSFVLSLGPSLLAGLLHTDSRVLAGSMAFAMFLTAAGVQFAVRRLDRRRVLVAGVAAATAAMAALVTAVHTSSVPVLVAAAILAGAGQGLGQLGGLSLLNSSVAPARLAEANAALNVGGYLPAGALPVAAGYLSDAAGLTTGATAFGVVLTALAVAGGLVVVTTGRAERSA
ncbi:MFS transporter [Streptomyces sp. NBC_00448]|uniref:MFS transporter n=1 Tax=Streptomyces sp. NBC_00448 TaxID=2903652 RepID=UPI002E1F775C